MRPILWLPIMVAIALAAPFGASASAASQQAESGRSEGGDFGQLLGPYFDRFYRGDYKAALAQVEKLELADTREGRSLSAALRAAALLGLKRGDEARRLFTEADRLWPDQPLITLVQFEAGMFTQTHDVAAGAVDRMIGRFPDAARALPWDVLRWFRQEDSKTQSKASEDRVIGLAMLGYGGDRPHGDYLAKTAMGHLLDRGDTAGAAELVQYVDEPDVIRSLLVLRRYAQLWSRVEEHAGPHLEKILASSVGSAQRAYEQAPHDPEVLQLYVDALVSAERFEEAIALRSKVPSTREGMAKADETIGWTVDSLARAFHRAGRGNEADALYALLNDAPMGPENWRVSMKINRIHLLVSDGRFDQALRLIEPTAKVPGSPYAKQLVRMLRYCAVAGVGRKDDAARLLPELLANAKDGYTATVEALACAGEFEKAEQVALSALADKSFQDDLVNAFQPPTDPARASVWEKGWAELRKRPALVREFERLGRLLPERLRPLPAKKLASAGG